MATVTLHGNPVSVSGNLPTNGQTAPDFSLVKGDLSDVGLAGFAGKRKVLNIFPSVDQRAQLQCVSSIAKSPPSAIPWCSAFLPTCHLLKLASAALKA